MSDQEEETVVEQETVGDLKRAKAAAKTSFTKVRRYLFTLLQKPEVNRKVIEDSCGELDHALERVMRVMEKLAIRYKMERDNKNEEKLSGETGLIEIEHSDAQNRAQQVIDMLSNSRSYNKFLKALLH